jgi:hypothetical protein
MGGRLDTAGIYQEDPAGKQVYLHCWFKNRGADKVRLKVHYVGCGRPGRSQQVDERAKNPEHQAWLAAHWVGRTLLFAKPRRLERLAWLEEVLVEYGCAEGLVVFETPFLAQAERVEARLIELYRTAEQAQFNVAGGKLPKKQLRAVPNLGCLRAHVEEIRRRHASHEGTGVLAREFGVTRKSIQDVVYMRTYKDS